MLRAGGVFVWAAQPVYKHEKSQQETWKGIWRNHFINFFPASMIRLDDVVFPRLC